MKKSYVDLMEKKWIWRLSAFVVPFLVSVLICIGCGIYPFGENCILHMDMYHQYCPFFMEFREKLVEGKSLLYSWNLGLGSDFVSLYAYYLASPFNWLLFFCPKGLVIEFMTLITWIKIALAGLFFYLYLEEHFHLKGKDSRYHMQTVMPALVFSTAYAFSGFVAAYSWNVMWMDSIALVPLVILGLERLVKENRPVLYYITLALSILCNFYISMILCIFLVLYFGILFLEKKGGKIAAAMRFAWYSLLAGGTGAVLLLPEAKVLSYTASADTTLAESVETYFSLLEEWSRLCVTAEPYTGNEHWPNLYCGAFTVLLFFLYVLNRRIDWKEKTLRLLLVGLLYVSFAIDYLDYLWHGLRFPNSLPGRQSFLFIFLLLTMGYETYRKRKGNRIWQIVLAMAVSVSLFVCSACLTPEEITGQTAFLLTVIFILAYGLCLVISRLGNRKMRQIMAGLMFGLAMGELVLNMAVTGFYSLDRTAYLEKQEAYEVLLDLAEEDTKADAPAQGMTFYRVEDTERKTKNDDALYGYPSATIFSSLMNIDVSHFYQSVYMEGGRNYYCYNGATPIVSSMLSVKYMLTDSYVEDNALRSLVGSYNGYYLYENHYCLPLGFMMTEESIENWDNGQGLKITQLNELAEVLGAQDPMLRSSDAEVEVSQGETVITVPEDGYYYGFYDKCSADHLMVSVNDGPSTRFGKTTHRYLFEYGPCKAGDEIRITNTKKEEIDFYVYRLNLDAMDTAYETLSSQTMQTHMYTDTSIQGEIDVTDAGRLILSVPNEEGWMLYVDGKETKILDFKETFISVYLEEGHHTIELQYMTPGLGTGAAISGLSLALFLSTCTIRNRVRKKNKMGDICEKETDQHCSSLL